MRLREYQVESLSAIYAELARPAPEPGLIVLPCGMGKTVIFTRAGKDLAAAGWRPLFMVNRNDLVQQTVEKFWATDPTLRVGVIQGERNEIYGTDVVIASVQSLSQKRLEKIPPGRFNVLFPDEAHYSAAESWQRVFKHFAPAPIVGFTATPSRSDEKGLGDTFTKILLQRDLVIARCIAGGRLGLQKDTHGVQL